MVELLLKYANIRTHEAQYNAVSYIKLFVISVRRVRLADEMIPVSANTPKPRIVTRRNTLQHTR